MDVEQALQAAQIVAIVGSCAVSIYLYIRAADREAVAAMQRQQQSIDMRLSVLETTVRHMPTHADLSAIQRELRELNSGQAALSERSETTLSMVRSIQEHLMEQGR